MEVDLGGLIARIAGVRNGIADAVGDALRVNGAAVEPNELGAAGDWDIAILSHDLLWATVNQSSDLIEEARRLAESRDGRPGRIVHLMPAIGVIPMRRQPTASAAAAMIAAAVRALAMSAAPHLLVNAVAAGAIGATDGLLSGDAAMLSHVPLGRTGSEADIANAVLFLVDPANSYTTGQVLTVDGGWTTAMPAISEMTMIQLRNGALSLGLAPELGGSIAWFRHDGVDLLRPLSAEAAARHDVLGVASFPMLPYANRIDGNSFTFEGATYRFEANNGTERFNVHGTGWHSAWTVADRSETAARLTLDHPGAKDPYAYRAAQSFALSPDRLSITTTIENGGSRRMPFGFGHHPWFPRDPDVILKFRASHFWLEAPEGVAGDRITLPPELDFADGAPLPASWRNNCYSGWDGLAEISFPSRGLGLRLSADPVFRHLMFYADPAKPYFCLEPQTNASGAFNKTGDDLGVIVLDAGRSAAGTLRLSPFVV